MDFSSPAGASTISPPASVLGSGLTVCPVSSLLHNAVDGVLGGAVLARWKLSLEVFLGQLLWAGVGGKRLLTHMGGCDVFMELGDFEVAMALFDTVIRAGVSCYRSTLAFRR